MIDFTKQVPPHTEMYIGAHDLFVEHYGLESPQRIGASEKPPLLFLHGAYSGSWMWSRILPKFVEEGWDCTAMNLRGHYRSRVVDLSVVSFEDYLEDIETVISTFNRPPVLIGHSMGGILGQKLAERVKLAGLVVVDSSISSEVNGEYPFPKLKQPLTGQVVPAPLREERFSSDETEAEIMIQRKYLTMESLKAMKAFSFLCGADPGISIDGGKIDCPVLVIKAVNSELDSQRGEATAKQLSASYAGIEKATHTGLLVGSSHERVATEINNWLLFSVK